MLQYAYSLLVVMFLMSCNTNSAVSTIQFTTSSDSTLFYYNIGWKQIMDEGNYGLAEKSYRKALDFDDTFLIGKAVLARLTLDLNERIHLYQDIQKNKSAIDGDERKILDVYNGLVYFTNSREQRSDKAQSIIDSVLIIAENNLSAIIHKYPEEVYLKSEYLEVLNSNYGANTAHDSLDVLCTLQQVDNPFILGFKSSLLAKEGNFNKAFKSAARLKHIINDPSIPKTYIVYADIYLKMDSLDIAKQYVDKAVLLDPRNLDASRLKTKIDNAIQEQN